MKRSLVALCAVLALCAVPALASAGQFETGRRAIGSMTGCYLVDYSYVETESLKPGYVRDARVYDVNVDKAVKEWIYEEEISPRKIRLQHILFAADLSGTVAPGSLLKHQAEDWEFEAPFLYDFVAPLNWVVRNLSDAPGTWTRRITNLDDGLRYQCAAAWNETTAKPEWSCDNYSPIPGRETRDMGRRDYQTLSRSTRIMTYGSSWLERQNNVKTIHQGEARAPLARELGKNWYVRIADSECAAARSFAEPRRAFWALLRETWDEVFAGDRPFVERTVAGQPPRFARMMAIEERHKGRDLADSATRAAAREEILRLIGEYRAE